MTNINNKNIWGSHFSLALIIASLAVCVEPVQAGPPNIINYQGYLVDSDGNPLGSTQDGTKYVSDPTNFKVQFKIYEEQTGENEKWSETQVVTVDIGYFNVYMGEVNPITSSVFDGNAPDQRYVGITVDLDNDDSFSDETEIAPRLRLLSAPYAMLSERAITAEKLLNGAKAEGDLEVVGKSTLANVEASGTLTVTDKTTLDNTDIEGNLDVTGNLIVAGSTTLVDVSAPTGTITAKKFVGNGTIPIGGIIMWSGTTANVPSGWAICDGNGNTSAGQNIPNLSDRFVVGQGAKFNRGEKSGQSEVTLKLEHLPEHTHDYKDSHGNRTTWTGDFKFGGRGDIYEWNNSNAYSNPTQVTEGVKGKLAKHVPVPTLPPYYALAFIIRTN
tara:strand:+ start:851 stop:2008 length:1158 start_codon:yes stop_codon:yes gene_type:complete